MIALIPRIFRFGLISMGMREILLKMEIEIQIDLMGEMSRETESR